MQIGSEMGAHAETGGSLVRGVQITISKKQSVNKHYHFQLTAQIDKEINYNCLDF